MPISNTSEKQVKQGKSNKTKKKSFLPVLLIMMLLAGSTAGAYVYFNEPAGAATETTNAGTARTVVTEKMDMSEVVVNLSGGGGHYLRVKITLEYPREKKLSDEIKKKKPQLMDVIITTLRSKTLEEVRPAGSVDNVKESLLNAINKNLDNGEVTGIYFTDYLIQ